MVDKYLLLCVMLSSRDGKKYVLLELCITHIAFMLSGNANFILSAR